MSRIDHVSQSSRDCPVAHRTPLHTRSVVRVLFCLAVIVMGVRLSGVAERLFYYPEQGPTWLPPRFTGGEKISFPSGDGQTLTGWFIPTQVPGADSGTAATILHVHGNAGNLIGHIGFSEYLPEAGFNLLLFDYRGFGESTGHATRRDPLLRDTNAALNYLLTRDDIDVDRIGLFGQSLGGAIGLNLMADRPEIKAAVIVSAFTSWRQQAGDVAGLGPLGRVLAWALISDHLRPDDAIARIDRPVLLIHGTADTLVPIQHSRRLRDAAGPGNVTLVELLGVDHVSLRQTHPEFDAITTEFYTRHLSGLSPQGHPDDT